MLGLAHEARAWLFFYEVTIKIRTTPGHAIMSTTPPLDSGANRRMLASGLGQEQWEPTGSDHAGGWTFRELSMSTPGCATVANTLR